MAMDRSGARTHVGHACVQASPDAVEAADTLAFVVGLELACGLPTREHPLNRAANARPATPISNMNWPVSARLPSGT